MDTDIQIMMEQCRRTGSQAQRKQNCIGLAYRYKYLSANVSVYAEARGSGGMLPQEKI